ncbi:methyl-accepting chemotaxis protein [Clostridium swellfunianum]|uniref:methyl-accepting chemotaxis protein n=1 Tax=Clostridium swellfunianum TaxID=1367462 RepID=UPI002030A633
MFKFMKNFKIKTIIIFLGVFSLISVALTNFLGLSGIYTVNKNMTDMYQNNLIGISRLAAARGDFLAVRLNAEKAMLQNDAKYEQEIKEHYEKAVGKLREYEATKLDEYEKNKVAEINEDINKYIASWDKDKSQQQLSDELAMLGDKIENNIVELREYNEKLAADKNSSSDKVYQSKIRMVFYITVIIIAAILLLGYIVTATVMRAIRAAIANLNTVASGDLSVSVVIDEKNEFAQMKKALNKTIENIRGMIELIKNQASALEDKSKGLSAVSKEMSLGAENVSKTIQDVAHGTSGQANEIIDTNMMLNDFNEQLEKVIEAMSSVASSSINVGEMAEDSNSKMNNLIESMQKIHEMFSDFAKKINNVGTSINKIDEISSLINAIADQTNLLALNASIEAARAGEAGRGFAVVADEIRKLAEQSKASSENINSVVKLISNETDIMINTSDQVGLEMSEQLKTIGVAASSYNKIIKAIKEMNPEIREASESMSSIQEQKDAIIQKLETASAVSQEVAASAEEIAASAEEMESSTEDVTDTAFELSNMTIEIVGALNKFKL